MKHLQTFRLIEAVARAGSMRKAAEDMNITASALNRRINRFEEEFGAELFERLSSGVRLNPAGELLLHHYRATASDLSRVQGQVADLSGERRGHVSIACSQALLPYFLPQQIALYRADHPGVTFSVNVRDRAQAEQELAAYSSDLALVFEPIYLVDFEVVHADPAGRQRRHAGRSSAGTQSRNSGCAIASTRRTSRLQRSMACATCSILPLDEARGASRPSSRPRASSSSGTMCCTRMSLASRYRSG